MSEVNTAELIKSAISGDRLAAESLIRLIQDKVYSLCLRMLWQTEDADEACQEILIKVITHLSQFKFESKFETWVYQIASHHLIDKKRSGLFAKGFSFTAFEEDLLSEQTEPLTENKNSPDFQLQLSEIRISCTTALLQCLDANHRAAYVFGEIFELDQNEATQILNISSDLYRKRLERARNAVESFTGRVCGVFSQEAKCQCKRRLKYAESCGRVDFAKYPFSQSSSEKSSVKLNVVEFIEKIEQAKRTATHYRLTGQFKSPMDYSKLLQQLLDQK